jgi:hypothetical protein
MQTNMQADVADSPIQSEALKDNQLRTPMYAVDVLMKPEECVMLLVDFQAGLGFGVESTSRQVVLNNAVALARTAVAFKVPVVASTSASRVYSGPLLPPLQEVLPSTKAIERRSMNAWEDDAARNAVVAAKALDRCWISHRSLCLLFCPFCAEKWLRGVRRCRRLRRLDPAESRTRPGKIGASRCTPDQLDTGSFGIPAGLDPP